jgi:hypothetical protein
MNSSRLVQIVLLLSLLMPAISGHASSLDEPWISHYRGDIEEELEKARLDNFSIQIMKDPDLIGGVGGQCDQNSVIPAAMYCRLGVRPR